MEELIDQMRVVLATTFSLYLKTHFFHWNVEGSNFPQYHKFFDELYQEIYQSIDPMAEQIRALGGYAPGSLSRFLELTKIEDERNILSAKKMVDELRRDNLILIDLLKKAATLAEKNNCGGLVNFLEERVDRHSKHNWQLTATVKE